MSSDTFAERLPATSESLPESLPPTASPTGPISASSRILGIDVARGFALLGILLVNAAFFSTPFFEFVQGPPVPEGLADRLVYWFTALFCTGKFYPLFSTLFGAGVAIMLASAKHSGRSFSWLYVRRMLLLGLFGVAHILLLWSGDILLLYSIVGMSMLVLGRCSPRVLLTTAAVSFAIGCLLTIGFGFLAHGQPLPTPPPEAAVIVLPEADSRIEQFLTIVTDGKGTGGFDPRLAEFERQVQTQGPFLDAMFLRVLLYCFAMLYYIAVAVWVVLASFCVGATLTKIGFFRQADCVWRKRLLWCGLVVGLPLSFAAVYLEQYREQTMADILSVLFNNLGGPLMCWGYLSGIVMLSERRPRSLLLGAIGNLGKMALSGYLLESLVMSAIMLHWGLGLFGSTSWSERFAIALIVYGSIVLLANLWLRFFRIGPVEWLWRSLTYWKMQPLR